MDYSWAGWLLFEVVRWAVIGTAGAFVLTLAAIPIIVLIDLVRGR